ncbi:FAD:protein FMN transferase [Hymenobacter defluvii]|uniref:FAD:protein FMN transferase n=1 Tax=Hymenobacter defluvii TaxID=2054411 RepID=A0ABS3TCL1_9BACT|nr:FAD:protein FMN transferase [Hymenobacter defluvii]MBO3270495.1 FAD:protein FMN transferase [Hymenobacter defluvii]
MIIQLLLAVIVSLWTPAPVPVQAFHLHGYAQGTTYTLTYYAADSVVKQAEVTQQLEEIDASLSLYRAGSLINQFNAAPRGVRADQHLQRVVGKALEVYRATNGLFDATVEPLVQAWGFGHQPAAGAPTPAAIQALLRSVGSDKLTLRGDSLLKQVPTLHLDLNGIAQGYTVDVLAALLERHGIRDYVVELGGELRVRGHRQPGGELLRIGIERPDTSAFALPALQQVIGLTAGGVTTSGNYRKFRRVGGQQAAHLINPKTGYPFRNELISVTVVAPDALTADAYDNALMGMGLDRALSFLRQNPDLQAYFIYQRSDGAVADTATVGFTKLLLHP